MSKVRGIEIEGLEPLLKAFKGLPPELEASVIRNIARKPGNKIVSRARKLFTRKDTGASKRSIGILPVKDRSQKFIEIGIKGRSLAYIWMFFAGGNRPTKKKGERGSIKPVGNVMEKAADQLSTSATKEMGVNINKIIARSLRRYLR
jgi:hypothetical protein